MKPFATITPKDVTLLLSTTYMTDLLWELQFGKPIEERVRRVPYDVVHLTYRYGIVPQWLLIDFLRVSCGVGQDVAVQLIKEAVNLNLITEVTPEGDPRQRLYRLMQEQLDKLHNIRKGTIMAYKISLIQSENPDDPEHGKTPENKFLYRNAMTFFVDKHERYHAIMKRLKGIRHLLNALIIAFAVVVTLCLLVDPSWATYSKAGSQF
jgi:hypothetical protein